jgi:broad specificity phosphatase PhoE
MTWGPDAQLTPKGIAQAQAAGAAWQTQLAAGAPFPNTFYSSPLTRSSDTLNITWAPFGVGQKKGPVPVVLEGLREVIGVHTCDERRTKSWISARFPKWSFEKGFTENDELWTPTDRETTDEQTARLRSAIVEILDNDDSTCMSTRSCRWYGNTHISSDISITAHSGAVAATLRAIGHRTFSLATGGQSLTIQVQSLVLTCPQR